MANEITAEMLALQDPVAVHANMLRGTIAKPSWANILHLYPVEALALVGAAYADAAEEIHKTIDECAAFDDKHGEQVLQRLADCLSQRTVPTPATAALARMLAEARADERERAMASIAAIPTPATEDQARGHEDAYRAVKARSMKGEGA